jgi:hypothetical protein
MSMWDNTSVREPEPRLLQGTGAKAGKKYREPEKIP